METYIKTVLDSLKEDNLTELRDFLERELTLCWKEAEKNSILFAEWIMVEGVLFVESTKRWWHKTHSCSTNELFNQFKKENNL